MSKAKGEVSDGGAAALDGVAFSWRRECRQSGDHSRPADSGPKALGQELLGRPSLEPSEFGSPGSTEEKVG